MICFTPAEIADRWKCSASHVRKMIDNGELPAFRVGGKLLRVREADLIAYEQGKNSNAAVGVGDEPSASSTASRAPAVVGLDAAIRNERQRQILSQARGRTAGRGAGTKGR